VSQAGLELSILLPQPPKCWDYSCAPPYLFFIYFLFIDFDEFSSIERPSGGMFLSTKHYIKSTFQVKLIRQNSFPSPI
jgi:hypothetical protein